MNPLCFVVKFLFMVPSKSHHILQDVKGVIWKSFVVNNRSIDEADKTLTPFKWRQISPNVPTKHQFVVGLFGTNLNPHEIDLYKA